MPAEKKLLKKTIKATKKGVYPLLTGIHYLPLPTLLVHVHPRVPERLAGKLTRQWDLKVMLRETICNDEF